MRKGYEGIIVATWMLFIAWALIAIVRLLF